MKTLFYIALVLLLGPMPGLAAELVVAPDGSGPYATIQDAIDAVNSGDIISLMAGTYTGPGNRNVYSDVTTTISPQFPGDEVLIDLQGSVSDPAYGILSDDGELTLVGLTFRNGYSISGGAIQVQNGILNAFDCNFFDNTASQGGAISSTYGDEVVLTDCILAWNTAAVEGGAIFVTNNGLLDMDGCTLLMNTCDRGSAVYREVNASLSMKACLVAFGRGTQGAFMDYYGGTAAAVNTDIWGNEGGNWTYSMAPLLGTAGNISLDPELCDPMDENFDLSANSPCWIPPILAIGAGGYDPTWTTPRYGLKADGSGMFGTIQAALDAVPADAGVVLETGTYVGAGNRELDFLGKKIILAARFGHIPVIDATDAGGTPRRAIWLHSGEPVGTTIRNITITNGNTTLAAAQSYPGYGGGMMIENGASVQLERVHFTGNTAEQLGASVAVMDGAATVAVDSCTFFNENSYDLIYAKAGALQFTNVTFQDRGPGTLRLVDGIDNATFSNCSFIHSTLPRIFSVAAPVRFENCYLEQFSGGFQIDIDLSTDVQFQNCNFVDGGDIDPQIMVCSQSVINFLDCDFQGNGVAGRDIVVLRMSTGSQITFTRATFSDWPTDGVHGVIRMGGDNSLNLNDCTFERCGLGVTNNTGYLGTMMISADNCVFDTVETAVKIAGSGADLINFTDTEFISCGAGMDLEDVLATDLTGCGFRGTGPRSPVRVNNSDLTVTDCEFHDGAVQDLESFEAGGIAGFESDVTVYTSEFLRNTCEGRAGGISMSFGDLLVQGSLFADNGNTSGTSLIVPGGAIYCGHFGGQCTISDTRIERNTTIYDGGGLFVESQAINLTDVVFEANQALYDGGGIYLNAGSAGNVNLTRCVIANNTAGEAGGGIDFYEGGSTQMTSCTVVGNGDANGDGQISTTFVALDMRYSIVAYGNGGPALTSLVPSELTLNVQCSDIYGNPGGDWTGPLATYSGVNGNIALTPEFCDLAAGNYYLAAASPCMGVENTCGVTMGALGSGCGTVSDIADLPLIREVALSQNHPNPFNPSTLIRFELPEVQQVSLGIYDVAGRLVRRLLDNEHLSAGGHEIRWHGKDSAGREQATGLYFYKLRAGDQELVRKMALVR